MLRVAIVWTDKCRLLLGCDLRVSTGTIKPHSLWFVIALVAISTKPSKKDFPRPWPTGCSKRSRLRYSFADLMAEPDRTTGWDGVRNYQARNFLRDQIQVGDGVLFYHSSADPPCIAGIAEVVREGHPDPTAFDRKDQHYDPKSDPANPTWYQVSIKGVRAIDPPLELAHLNTVAELAGMELLRKGSRLSVQPVTERKWKTILAMAKSKTKRS